MSNAVKRGTLLYEILSHSPPFTAATMLNVLSAHRPEPWLDFPASVAYAAGAAVPPQKCERAGPR